MILIATLGNSYCTALCTEQYSTRFRWAAVALLALDGAHGAARHRARAARAAAGRTAPRSARIQTHTKYCSPRAHCTAPVGGLCVHYPGSHGSRASAQARAMGPACVCAARGGTDIRYGHCTFSFNTGPYLRQVCSRRVGIGRVYFSVRFVGASQPPLEMIRARVPPPTPH